MTPKIAIKLRRRRLFTYTVTRCEQLTIKIWSINANSKKKLHSFQEMLTLAVLNGVYHRLTVSAYKCRLPLKTICRACLGVLASRYYGNNVKFLYSALLRSHISSNSRGTFTTQRSQVESYRRTFAGAIFIGPPSQWRPIETQAFGIMKILSRLQNWNNASLTRSSNRWRSEPPPVNCALIFPSATNRQQDRVRPGTCSNTIIRQPDQRRITPTIRRHGPQCLTANW